MTKIDAEKRYVIRKIAEAIVHYTTAIGVIPRYPENDTAIAQYEKLLEGELESMKEALK